MSKTARLLISAAVPTAAFALCTVGKSLIPYVLGAAFWLMFAAVIYASTYDGEGS